MAKADTFESRVFRAIEDELKSDRLGLAPAIAKLFAKKGYYSRDHDSAIFVDISIEVWPAHAVHWSMLWVCERMDYSGSVPVRDIEEFHAKLNQIAGVNKKGVVVISGALHESALQYARSNGIGVIRLLPDDQIQPIVESRELPDIDMQQEFHQALTQPDFVGKNRFYASYAGDIFGDWHSILKKMLHTL